jgi:hypothetical protein
MTPQEHKLVLFMLAQQTVRFKALLEALKSRGILENDDFLAFEHLAKSQEDQTHALFLATVEQYTEFAHLLGVDTLPEKP